MTQHKEEWGEYEEDNPEIIHGGGNDEDSGEESGSEDEVDIGKNKKDAGKASPIEAKGESLTETVCEGMEEKEKKRKEKERKEKKRKEKKRKEKKRKEKERKGKERKEKKRK
eukprot:13292507-Ditylum_brightwellii.AAC.1